MSVSAAISDSPGARRIARLQEALWRHPEWWTLAISLVAWCVLMAQAASPDPHAHHAGMGGGWTRQTLHWLTMVLAMMLPLLLDPMRTVAARSFWRRRNWAMAEFLLGYLFLWVAVGALVSLVPSFGPAAMVTVFAAAAAWQITPLKRRALLACHRTMPLAPYGWAARRDCVIHGGSSGLRCLTSCWALMLACAWSGHSLPAMVGLSAVGITERCQRQPDQRVLAGAVLGIGVVVWLLR